MVRFCLVPMVAIFGLAAVPCRADTGRGGQLQINVVDRDTGQPLACRMHLKNAANRVQKAPKMPFWSDHFCFSGELTLKLPNGNYSFDVECGAEYLTRSGHFTINDFANDTKTVDMKRFVDMAKEGWWSGDLNVNRPAKDMELLMQADDLHVAPLVTWTNQRSEWAGGEVPKQPLVEFAGQRYCHLLGGWDARAGGSLLLLNMQHPLNLASAKPEFPPALDLIAPVQQKMGVWVDVEKATSWDMPAWVASGRVDSIELANSHFGRLSMIAKDADGKPRDKKLYPEPLGSAHWTEAVYYHLLNCGLRIPPSAGSGSGVSPNPVGYNRVYVQVDDAFTYEKWWQGLRAGRVVVTNGPLIRPSVEGEPPGHVFHAAAGEAVELEIGLTLSTRDKVAYLEIVQNGHVAHNIRLDEWNKLGGRLPKLKFTSSGWFLVRAVAENRQTYRFASTGPYYVEIGYQPRISKASAQFFLDWVNERIGNLERSKELDNEAQREAVLKYHRAAREFWQDRVSKANAE